MNLCWACALASPVTFLTGDHVMQIGFGQISPSASSTRDLGTRLRHCIWNNIYFHVTFRCIINCEPKISPSVKLSIQSQCYGLQCSNISSYQWILYEQYSTATNDDTVWRKRQDLQLITTTPNNSRSIVIKEDSLDGGKYYRLAVFVETMDGHQGMSAHDISTASPPTNGTCSITPSSGTSLKTSFTLSCSDWESDSKPLSYRFQYLHGLLYDGSNSSVSSRLRSGSLSWNCTVRVNVTVTNDYGVSAPTFPLSVQALLRHISNEYQTRILNIDRLSLSTSQLLSHITPEYFCRLNHFQSSRVQNTSPDLSQQTAASLTMQSKLGI